MTLKPIIYKTRVRVKKIGQSKDPDCPTPDFDKYICGVDNGDVSLPIEYELTGSLVFDVREGYSMQVARDSRNGEKVLGSFSSSIVKKIRQKSETSYLVETANSQYLVEEI